MSAMFSWLRKQNRVAANPFELVTKVDARGKESFHRRALNDDEARRLLTIPRRALYLLALHTGLRRGEINALRWADLHLDVANPFYVVPVAKSKSRKEQPRPLHPELVRVLQAMKSAGKLTPENLVFPERVPAMKVIRADFKTAGIPLVDERGHRVDFHALRMTDITRLQRAGVSPREAMELARHSDMRLTMKTYTDAAQLPLAATVRGLPSFNDTQIDSQILVAGGQFMSPSVIGLKPIKVGKTVENIDEHHDVSPIVTFSHGSKNGGERGIRTPGSVTYARFPGVCLKPLSHLSGRLSAGIFAGSELLFLTNMRSEQADSVFTQERQTGGGSAIWRNPARFTKQLLPSVFMLIERTGNSYKYFARQQTAGCLQLGALRRDGFDLLPPEKLDATTLTAKLWKRIREPARRGFSSTTQDI